MKVSIVIPCYNSAEYLPMTLRSVMGQSYTDLELICINDGSTDSTLDVLEDFRSINPSMILIDQVNSGSNAARNKGLEASTGSYIQFLDADDGLDEKKIAFQVARAKELSFPSIIIGSYEKIGEDGELIFKKPYTSDVGNIWQRLMKTDLGITSSLLFKKEEVLKAGSWDESLKSSQEYDLMFRILKNNMNVAFSEPIHTTVLQRKSGSITSTKRGENWERYIQLRLSMRDFAIEKGIEIERQEMDQILFDAIRMLYPYDSKKALSLFEEHLPHDFEPRVSELTSSSYVRLFHLMGFSGLQRLHSIFRR